MMDNSINFADEQAGFLGIFKDSLGFLGIPGIVEGFLESWGNNFGIFGINFRFFGDFEGFFQDFEGFLGIFGHL